ncbi:hypothetical protein IMZ48_29635 [Candidatus Bathyarchaeota archaeon]|nr:hypothetical protein [Candidatus Bathyarchaeota archaeon]
MSKFPEQPIEWYQNNYLYHEQGGSGIDVYIIDTGAKLAHPVSGVVPYIPNGRGADIDGHLAGVHTGQ